MIIQDDLKEFFQLLNENNKVFFISRGDLLTTKKSAGRPQDIRDLEELEN